MKASLWSRVAVGDLLTRPLRNGISPSSKGTVTAEVLTLSAVTGPRFDPTARKTARFESEHTPEKTVRGADLLICRGNGNIGLVGRARRPGVDMPDVAFPDTMIGASFDPRCVDPTFLEYIWDSQVVRGQVEELARSTNGTHKINQGMVESIEIPLPPIEEQRRIAAVLDAADTLRAKRREALAKLDTLTQAIFIDMFGPTGLAGELMVLGDALANAKLFTDGDWVESKDQDPTGEVRLTQLADIGVGTWLDKSERYMNRATADRLKCTFLEPGDVLLARMPDPIGRACIFPGDRRPSVTAVDVCIIRPNPESLDARWLVEALNLPRTQSEIGRRATGSTRSRISRRNLAKVEVAVPPLDAQREFAARASEVERGRSAHVGSGERLDDLFSSLQQRAFQGEL